MIDLRELYQEIIIDHNKNPRNHREMTHPSCQADGYNPLCGDKLSLYLQIEHDVIRDISFLGKGCAISQASASLMTEMLKGKTLEDARRMFDRVHHMLTVEGDDDMSNLDKLSVLAGVKAYPARVKCATLAWHTLCAALKKEYETVSTE